MKELSIKEKAKCYDKALKVLHKYDGANIMFSQSLKEEMFPELKESEDENVDEKVRKALIKLVTNYASMDLFIEYDIHLDEALSWLKKQGEKEQLYIRFGEIPTDEKSKIYQGEIEVGTENGVSVYPAFKTDEGNIVLGLNLPITKTTLYTQQHLIEYDDRPCYLVKGDYVGKDTDGQPLINNVSIIEKIDSYRVKEEKQGKQNPADKVEPKFKVGDWIVKENIVYHIDKISGVYLTLSTLDGTALVYHINVLDNDKIHLWTIQDAKDGDVLASKSGNKIFSYRGSLDLKGRPCAYYGIYKVYDGIRFTPCAIGNYFTYEEVYPATKEQRDTLFAEMKKAGYEWDAEKKELKKIEQKPVIPKFRVDDVITDNTGVFPHKKIEAIENENYVVRCLYTNNQQCIPINAQDEYMLVNQNPAWSEEDEKILKHIIINIENLQFSEDMREKYYHISNTSKNYYQIIIKWLKTIKDRVQPKQEWREEDEKMFEKVIKALSAYADKLQYEGFCHNKDVIQEYIDWLKSLRLQNKYAYNPYKAVVESIAEMCKHYEYVDVGYLQDFYDNVKVKCKDAKEYDSLFPQNTWKPSDEQINALQTAIGIVGELTSTASLLKEIREQLKKLREEYL